MITLTKEQNEIVTTATQSIGTDSHTLIKIDSVAGASKSFIATLLINNLTVDYKGLYLVFGLANKNEMQAKMVHNKSITISTFAGLAVKYLKQAEFELDFNTRYDDAFFHSIYTDEEIRVPKHKKMIGHFTMHLFKRYLQSPEMLVREVMRTDRELIIEASYYKFMSKEIEEQIIQKVRTMFSLYLSKKTLPIPQIAHTKVLHSYLVQKLINIKSDFLILDEAGDVSPLDLNIFKLIQANLKIIAGDQHQAIMSFRGTTNAFINLKKEGISLNLTTSFRVPKQIGLKIEAFGKYFLDPLFKFKGYELANSSKDKIYLFRTNINIFKFVMNNPESTYRFIKDVKLLFGGFVKAMEFIHNPEGSTRLTGEYLFISRLYYRFKKISTRKVFIDWLATEQRHDRNVQGLLLKSKTMSLKDIRDTYQRMELMNQEDTTTDWLGNAHIVKGAEYGEVVIGHDFTYYIARSLLNQTQTRVRKLEELTFKDKEELRLLYVVSTRTNDKLSGYTLHLDNPKEFLKELQETAKEMLKPPTIDWNKIV